MLSVVRQSVVMLSVVMLRVVMLSVIMLNVVMLSVVALLKHPQITELIVVFFTETPATGITAVPQTHKGST